MLLILLDNSLRRDDSRGYCEFIASSLLHILLCLQQELQAHVYSQVNVVIIKGDGNITTIINGHRNNVNAIAKGRSS